MAVDDDLLQFSVQGFTNAKDMEAHARKESTEQSMILKSSPIKGNLDLNKLNKIHKALFGNVYTFAGQTRQMMDKDYKLRNIALKHPEKANHFTRFAAADTLADKADALFGKLQDDNYLKGLSEKQFATKLTEFMATANDLHFYREGNGRSLRHAVSQLTQEAGHSVSWDMINKDALHKAFNQATDTLMRYDGGVMVAEKADNTALGKIIDQVVGAKNRDYKRDHANALRNHSMVQIFRASRIYPELKPVTKLLNTIHYDLQQNPKLASSLIDNVINHVKEKAAQMVHNGISPTEKMLNVTKDNQLKKELSQSKDKDRGIDR